jgi:hypothetical protein
MSLGGRAPATVFVSLISQIAETCRFLQDAHIYAASLQHTRAWAFVQTLDGPLLTGDNLQTVALIAPDFASPVRGRRFRRVGSRDDATGKGMLRS